VASLHHAGILGKMTLGQEITDQAYVSTASDPGKAAMFAEMRSYGHAPGMATTVKPHGGKPVLMKITAPAGTHAFQGQVTLSEWILPRGSRFKVTSVSADGSVISMDALPPGPVARVMTDDELMDAHDQSLQRNTAAYAYKSEATSGDAERMAWAPGDITFTNTEKSLRRQVELNGQEFAAKAGKEGYIHGWVCVRPPCGQPGGQISHPDHGDGVVAADGTAHFDDGTTSRLGDRKELPLEPWHAASSYVTMGYTVSQNLRKDVDLSTIDAGLSSKLAEAMDGYMRPVGKKIKLYRGIADSSKVFGPVGSMTGKTVMDNGFTSTTAKKKSAEDYSHVGLGMHHGDRALLTFKLNPGDKAVSINKLNGGRPEYGEREHVLPRNTAFRVTSDEMGTDSDGVPQRHISLEYANETSAEKALRRFVSLNGQEAWEDIPDTVPPAAGGGAMTMPPVPGGVPGFTAGAEPPRWDGSSPQPRVLSVPSDQDDADYPQGRARSERPHAAFPSGPQGMDGYWPAGQPQPQAGTSSPGGATGVPPSTVGSKPSNGKKPKQVRKLVSDDDGKTVAPLASVVEKVGPHGYIHGWIKVEPGDVDPDVARTGDELWQTDEGISGISDDDKAKIGKDYYATWESEVTQHILRHPKESAAVGLEPGEGVQSLKNAISVAKPFQSPVTVYRGVTDARPFLGKTGSQIGKIFTERGFLSTTASAEVGDQHRGYGMGVNSAVIHIHVPAGERALKVTQNILPAAKNNPDVADSMREYTFTPGSQLRITSDEKTGTGKKAHREVHADLLPQSAQKSQPADVIKVGKEGYIHGYICVRPPCGPQYTEATFDSSKGSVDHDGTRIGKMRKNPDGTYSMTHFAADGTKTRLTATHPTRGEAALSISTFHDVDTLHREASDEPVKQPLGEAREALAAGDKAGAERALAVARDAARGDGNTGLASHVEHVRTVLAGEDAVEPKPVASASSTLKPESAISPEPLNSYPDGWSQEAADKN
jgi:hypothetical protein